MKNYKYKFSQQDYSQMLALISIWIEELKNSELTKLQFYQLGFLHSIAVKMQKAGTNALTNIERKSQISLSVYEIDTLISLANLTDQTSYILTNIQLNLPDIVIDINSNKSILL